MMRRLPYHRWIAVALLLTLVPGVGEMVENVGHVLTQGHLAHAGEDGDEHSDTGAEHGCTGTFHLCACHVSVSFVEPGSLPGLVSPLSGHTVLAEPPSPRAGFHQIPEQPPQA